MFLSFHSRKEGHFGPSKILAVNFKARAPYARMLWFLFAIRVHILLFELCSEPKITSRRGCVYFKAPNTVSSIPLNMTERSNYGNRYSLDDCSRLYALNPLPHSFH